MQPIPPLPLPPSPPLPQLVKVTYCEACRHQYGNYQVCKGSAVLENWGRIMQMCTNCTCHRTVFHTTAYPFAVSEQLVNQLNILNRTSYNYAPRLPAPALAYAALSQPHALGPAGSFPAPTASASNDSRSIHCSKCKTRTGHPRRAAKNCISSLCSSCCDTDFLDAVKAHHFRDDCAAHSNNTAQPQQVPSSQLSNSNSVGLQPAGPVAVQAASAGPSQHSEAAATESLGLPI
ncbi:hypothetical protein JB92DRAFT_3111248 [Gautieria morchelliformis]|nr:hypothetical protein JB92DRAFT_3111248 [Gautieria morchelliformis]